MVLMLIIFMIVFWGSWFYSNSQEASLFLWLTVLCCSIGSMDSSWSSSLVLGLVVLFFGGMNKLSSVFQSWSEVAFHSLVVLMFVTVSLVLWSGDFLSTLVAIEVLHLTMAVLLVNSRNYNQILLFLLTGFVLTVILLLALPVSLSLIGSLDITSLLVTNDLICLLILGKLYILPWVLVCALLYSGATFDMITSMSLLFSVHYTIWLLNIISTINSFAILMILVISLALAVLGLLNSGSVNIFVGYSYCITTHLLIILSMLDSSFNHELVILLLSLYIVLSLPFLLLLNSSSVNTLENLEGLHNQSVVHSSILLLILCGFLGLPPSLFFMLKVSIGYQSYLILPILYIYIVIIGLITSYCYIRLILRLLMESKSTLYLKSDRSSSILSALSINLVPIIIFCIL